MSVQSLTLVTLPQTLQVELQNSRAFQSRHHWLRNSDKARLFRHNCRKAGLNQAIWPFPCNCRQNCIFWLLHSCFWKYREKTDAAVLCQGWKSGWPDCCLPIGNSLGYRLSCKRHLRWSMANSLQIATCTSLYVQRTDVSETYHFSPMNEVKQGSHSRCI